MNDDKQVRLDRMRYTKNTLASGLALLSILFDVFFFISIYESNVGSWYYNVLMGASILYNLIFLLAAFLSSEGIKNYKISYSYLMIALGIGQIIRIFIYPMARARRYRHHPGTGCHRYGEPAVYPLRIVSGDFRRLPLRGRFRRHDPFQAAQGTSPVSGRRGIKEGKNVWHN